MLSQSVPKQGDLLGDDREPPRPRYTDAQTLTGYFRTAWRAKFGSEYTVEAQDGKLLKQLAVNKGGVDAVKAGIDRFLAAEWDDDSWVMSTGCSVSALVRTWNQLAVKAARKPAAARVLGCQHRPPCTTPKQHADRYEADLRR